MISFCRHIKKKASNCSCNTLTIHSSSLSTPCAVICWALAKVCPQCWINGLRFSRLRSGFQGSPAVSTPGDPHKVWVWWWKTRVGGQHQDYSSFRINTSLLYSGCVHCSRSKLTQNNIPGSPKSVSQMHFGPCSTRETEMGVILSVIHVAIVEEKTGYRGILAESPCALQVWSTDPSEKGNGGAGSCGFLMGTGDWHSLAHVAPLSVPPDLTAFGF